MSRPGGSCQPGPRPDAREIRPDFLIIGAMKSATSTLHAQLARQPGIFMSRLKEPNYFSDDEVYAKGWGWYQRHFAKAGGTDLRGESSTHYTKGPSFPRTVERMRRDLPAVRLIYILRHPVDRLVSHYLHDRIRRTITVGVDDAIQSHPELIDYGRYAFQLEPYLRAFGPSRILLVAFDRLVVSPQEELERICRFLGCAQHPQWDFGLRPQNVTREQLRRSAARELLVKLPGLGALRRHLLPDRWSERLKLWWRMDEERPHLSEETLEKLAEVFDPDLERVGAWTGRALSCDRFAAEMRERSPEWAEPVFRSFPMG